MEYTQEMHEQKVLRRADTHDEVFPYSADCPACLRGRAHSNREHEQAIKRGTECSADELPESDYYGN